VKQREAIEVEMRKLQEALKQKMAENAELAGRCKQQESTLQRSKEMEKQH